MLLLPIRVFLGRRGNETVLDIAIRKEFIDIVKLLLKYDLGKENVEKNLAILIEKINANIDSVFPKTNTYISVINLCNMAEQLCSYLIVNQGMTADAMFKLCLMLFSRAGARYELGKMDQAYSDIVCVEDIITQGGKTALEKTVFDLAFALILFKLGEGKKALTHAQHYLFFIENGENFELAKEKGTSNKWCCFFWKYFFRNHTYSQSTINCIKEEKLFELYSHMIIHYICENNFLSALEKMQNYREIWNEHYRNNLLSRHELNTKDVSGKIIGITGLSILEKCLLKIDPKIEQWDNSEFITNIAELLSGNRIWHRRITSKTNTIATILYTLIMWNCDNLAAQLLNNMFIQTESTEQKILLLFSELYTATYCVIHMQHDTLEKVRKIHFPSVEVLSDFNIFFSFWCECRKPREEIELADGCSKKMLTIKRMMYLFDKLLGLSEARSNHNIMYIGSLIRAIMYCILGQYYDAMTDLEYCFTFANGQDLSYKIMTRRLTYMILNILEQGGKQIAIEKANYNRVTVGLHWKGERPENKSIFTGKDFIHVTLRTYIGCKNGKGIYASFWPVIPHKKSEKTDGYVGILKSRERDLLYYGCEPNISFDLYTLDVGKINRAFMSFEEKVKKGECDWHLKGSIQGGDSMQSCSGLVAMLLNQGNITEILKYSSYPREHMGKKVGFRVAIAVGVAGFAVLAGALISVATKNTKFAGDVAQKLVTHINFEPAAKFTVKEMIKLGGKIGKALDKINDPIEVEQILEAAKTFEEKKYLLINDEKNTSMHRKVMEHTKKAEEREKITLDECANHRVLDIYRTLYVLSLVCKDFNRIIFQEATTAENESVDYNKYLSQIINVFILPFLVDNTTHKEYIKLHQNHTLFFHAHVNKESTNTQENTQCEEHVVQPLLNNQIDQEAEEFLDHLKDIASSFRSEGSLITMEFNYDLTK